MDLLQPHLMSREELLTILAQRQIRNLDKSLDKDELVRIFSKYCMPIHRRESRRTPAPLTNRDSGTDDKCAGFDRLRISSDRAGNPFIPLKQQRSNMMVTDENETKKQRLDVSNGQIIDAHTKIDCKKNYHEREEDNDTHSTCKRKRILWP